MHSYSGIRSIERTLGHYVSFRCHSVLFKKMAGITARSEWHHQFLDDATDVKALANAINDYFISLTNDFVPIVHPGPQPVHEDLFVSTAEVARSLSSLNTSKATGPDNLPNRLLKEFAPELAPVIQDLFNQSLVEGTLPALLKSSIVTPIPKVSPPSLIEKDLRPISLTCTLAKVLEGFTCKRLLSEIDGKIDPRQYARKGHSTTDALLYILQPIYEATDSGNAGARLFFADFSKGFDLIDHNILLEELRGLEVSPSIISWIAGFLAGRNQAVRIEGTLSDWKTLNGGIPQGTKLGVILFAVMTNRLLRRWHLRTKFVDDTTAVEILPRNSMSYINMLADDVHRFSTSHRMKLNPAKCKEMIINFMAYPNFGVRPICIGDSVVECVESYKLLGLYIDNDLKWNSHIDYIIKKIIK